jgi:hypothetical protein
MAPQGFEHQATAGQGSLPPGRGGAGVGAEPQKWRAPGGRGESQQGRLIAQQRQGRTALIGPGLTAAGMDGVHVAVGAVALQIAPGGDTHGLPPAHLMGPVGIEPAGQECQVRRQRLRLAGPGAAGAGQGSGAPPVQLLHQLQRQAPRVSRPHPLPQPAAGEPAPRWWLLHGGKHSEDHAGKAEPWARPACRAVLRSAMPANASRSWPISDHLPGGGRMRRSRRWPSTRR